MSDQDFQAGYRGEGYQYDRNQMSYEAGQAKRKREDEASKPAAPPVEVDGVGFTMLLIAPLLAIMYPVAGVTMTAVIGGSVWFLGLSFSKVPGRQILAGLALLVVGLK